MPDIIVAIAIVGIGLFLAGALALAIIESLEMHR